MFIWFGFIVSLIIILVIARKHLPLALFCGAIVLGLFTLKLPVLGSIIFATFTDLSVVLLACAMGIIPMIGGTMKESGQMDGLVNNLRIGRKGLMALSPAIMGLLPMPGGALLSAPILEKGGVGVPDDLKVAINDWFRHLFVLIYPLSSALIATAKITELNLYTAMVSLLPTCAFAAILGWLFFIRKVKGKISYDRGFSLKNLLLPFGIILVAPILDFSLKKICILPIAEIATVLGVSAAFILSISLSAVPLDLNSIAKKMRPWNFFLIIMGMFIFLNVFKTSNAADLIASIPLPRTTLCVVAGFILGFATGRVLLPASIIFPVYMTAMKITPVAFAVIYASVFFGYMISPVHPCVGVSLEYFRVSMKDFTKMMWKPTMIVFVVAFILSFVTT